MSGANGGLNVSIGGNTISHLIPLTLRVSHTPAIEIGSCFFSIFVSGKRACEDILARRRNVRGRALLYTTAFCFRPVVHIWRAATSLECAPFKLFKSSLLRNRGKRKSFERRKARSKHFGTLQNRFISRLRRVSRSWRIIRAWCN